MHKIFFWIILVAIIVGGWWMWKGDTRGSNNISPTTTQSEGDLMKSLTQTDTPKSETKVASEQPQTQITKIMHATLHTNQGDITIEFFPQNAPNTVKNFIRLAEAKFYDGVKFHRVIKDFMIQGGDPLTKDDAHPELWGTGGPGYRIPDELGAQNKNNLGTISMANAGPNTGGSQFFINTKDNNFLDDKHTVFGQVVKGMDIVRFIESTPTGTNDRPLSPIIIKSVTLE